MNGSPAVLGDVEGIEVIGVDENDSIFRDDVEEAAEAGFNFVEVFKDIGVVEFQVVDNNEFGEVVQELGAFIKEGRVVFVALENHMLGGVEGAALAQVFGNTANHVGWSESRRLENPG